MSCAQLTEETIDPELEQQIETQKQLLREDRSPDENKATWLELTRLHALRSKERIEQMERERGIR